MKPVTVPITDPFDIRGVRFPRGVTFNQIVVTGPAGSGKSGLIRRLGGWPQEGFLDLSQRGWWASRCLSYRPCQVHLGFPRVAAGENLSSGFAYVEPSRLVMPAMRRSLFLPEWRRRLCFVVLLPPPNDVFVARCKRARYGTHPVDRELSREIVSRQCSEYGEAARLLVAAGFQVLVQESFEGPLRILLPEDADICKPKPAMAGAVWPLLH